MTERDYIDLGIRICDQPRIYGLLEAKSANGAILLAKAKVQAMQGAVDTCWRIFQYGDLFWATASTTNTKALKALCIPMAHTLFLTKEEESPPEEDVGLSEDLQSQGNALLAAHQSLRAEYRKRMTAVREWTKEMEALLMEQKITGVSRPYVQLSLLNQLDTITAFSPWETLPIPPAGK